MYVNASACAFNLSSSVPGRISRSTTRFSATLTIVVCYVRLRQNVEEYRGRCYTGRFSAGINRCQDR